MDRLDAAGIGRESSEWHREVTSVRNRNYRFVRLNLEDKSAIEEIFDRYRFDSVVHLAAQPGVRYSLINPEAYVQSNVVGFLNILEGCRHHKVGHLVYASSSSVYGLNESMPLSTSHTVDHPVSLYAATKKSNELMAHTYSHLFNLPTTGLRFFTVYGPWGRPDMAAQLFADAIIHDRPLKIFNEGKLSRDFTFVDDIVEGVYLVSERPASPDIEWSSVHPQPASSKAPYKIYNIGNSNPVQLMDFISQMETALGKEAIKTYLPMQPGDVEHTYADVKPLQQDFGYRPKTKLDEGLTSFATWYRDYYSPITPKRSE